MAETNGITDWRHEFHFLELLESSNCNWPIRQEGGNHPFSMFFNNWWISWMSYWASSLPHKDSLYLGWWKFPGTKVTVGLPSSWGLLGNQLWDNITEGEICRLRGNGQSISLRMFSLEDLLAFNPTISQSAASQYVFQLKFVEKRFFIYVPKFNILNKMIHK